MDTIGTCSDRFSKNEACMCDLGKKNDEIDAIQNKKTINKNRR